MARKDAKGANKTVGDVEGRNAGSGGAGGRDTVTELESRDLLNWHGIGASTGQADGGPCELARKDAKGAMKTVGEVGVRDSGSGGAGGRGAGSLVVVGRL